MFAGTCDVRRNKQKARSGFFLCLSCETLFSNVIDAPSSYFQATAALRISLNWHLRGVRTEKQRVSIQADVGDFSGPQRLLHWCTRIFE